MNRSSISPHRVTAGILLLSLASFFSVTPVSAQTTTPTVTITIAGDVYGGGKQGAVGTGNLDTGITNDTDAENVKFATGKDASAATTVVTLNGGTVRTVFGGGENGRTYGSTSVTVKEVNSALPTTIGGTVNGKDWTETIYGGLFGAGDGQSALVFGNSSVTVQGGTVYQNVYGGGNQANLMGKTTVTLQGGNMLKSVFGGARMASIFGYSHVNVDGTNAANDLVVNAVYGGNDISGKIERSTNANWTWVTSLTKPSTLTKAGTIGIGNDYNAFVQTTPSGANTNKVYIGQLFGGGNGDYAYTDNGTKLTLNTGLDDDTSTVDVDESKKTFAGLELPEVAKAYLELTGGTYGYVYGGGNAATVTGATDICIDNADDITLAGMASGAVVDDTRLHDMGINLTTFTNDYQFIRVFGGNNKATMDIRPTWHLTKGSINDLFSGGNQGDMTNAQGILLSVTGADMTINNIYGGCRMADVDPEGKKGVGLNILSETKTVGATDYQFQAGYSAKVLVTNGKINNVYGGNDVSGNVYGGTQLEIHHSIIKDVYGGGNGSYAYTDKTTLMNDEMYGDFYYAVPSGATSLQSAQALNKFRPNVEKTWVHVAGASESNPTYIGGALYCGGNSATLRKIGADALAENDGTTAHLQFGSHVIAKSMFLGSNGENMVRGKVLEFTQNSSGVWSSTEKDILAKYADSNFSSMTLTDSPTFEEYMRGVEVAIKPTVSFDTGYTNYSTKVGSLYCGGNVGSMSASGYFDVAFLQQLVIFEKLVGGCNNANVAMSTYNAFHEGGLITRNDPVKVELNVEGLKLEPRKLTYDATNNTYSYSEWNTDTDGKLLYGNIYGGCYASGYINGGVRINLKSNAISDAVTAAADGTTIPTLDTHRDDVFCTALSVFGAGYGEDAEIWGNTEINVSDDAAKILKVFGGGEMGVVGNLTRGTDGVRTGAIDAPYNTTINLTAGNVGKIYGGGFEGPVTGHTTVNLVGGTAYDVIGGACNADIEEYAETYVGKAGASTVPTVTHNVYGANDFGGTIKGSKSFSDRVSTTAAGMVYNNTLLTAAAYVEYTKGKANYIFGGAKAAYDYKDQTLYSKYTNADGTVKGDFVKPAIGNAFVNFRPEHATANSIARVYGAGQGYFNERDKDLLQSNSYVLIDIPADVEQFASLEVFGAGDYSGVGINIPSADVSTAEASSTTDVTAAAVIDLARGNINRVYGGSYKQGFTRRTIVNVPIGSTIDMNYLYGGAYGVASADGHTLGNLYPCDVYESNVNYKSTTARCRTIYGGNNSYRRTLYTHVNIHTPVRYVHRTYGLTHANVFGAGYGENTWAQYTEVNLVDSAKVYEPYGGGEAGNVYNKETITSLASTKGWDITIPGDYSSTDATLDHGGLTNALAHTSQLYLDYVTIPQTNIGENLATKYGINVAPKYNTNVHIHRGATVVNYAYGAGLGSHIYQYQFDGNTTGNTQPQPSDYQTGATTANDLDEEARAKYDAALAVFNNYGNYQSGDIVGKYEYNLFNDTQKTHWRLIGHRTTAVLSGTSYIDLLGGTVTKDLYAAGITGSVQDTLMLKSFTASSTAYIKGGLARNVYGGGWEGPVGKHNEADGHTNLTNDVLGETNVIVGRPEEEIAVEFTAAGAGIDEDEYFYFNGVPSISRNVYAGGEGGVVRGTANLDLFNGVVGYKNKHRDDITESENNYYRLSVVDGHVKYIPLKRGDDLSAEEYYFVEEIDQDKVGDNIMFEAGNAFGGGYAANSDVDIANLTLWNGIVRNSLYGGGEIATIGRGTQTKNTTTGLYEQTIYKPGQTHVTMWGGHVLRDVFGGGRGFNNWKTENKDEGNTNGFIFGTTDVNIHYGTIGTIDGVAKGYGNVFGGGNIGFVYSQYGKETDGWYYEDYSNNKLSEDTRVEVKAYGRALENVTIGSTTYMKGDYIPNTALDQLTNNDSDKPKWAKVDQSGITIYNAVFAGGNVSAGSDKIMAFSKTVYGNSTASVVDIFARDLVSIGGKGVGGLYGDGNLTFVDGYRELNLTNYGTDWFSLSKGVETDAEFNALTPRQQSFYTTQYECITAYEGYDVGDVILNDVYQYVSDAYKANWRRRQSIVNEGRFINTVQRCDFCGIKGSRIVLHGAIDRAQDEAEADYTNYTINRVGELSLNQNGTHGSYFGIYNVLKFLGGVTSDVRFAGDGAAVRTTESATTGDYQADGKTYYQWKQAHLDDNMRNDGSAPNKIALSSGVFLEIVKELDPNGNKVYGPITGVVELDLLNVSAGEGGGYVYAKNIHGTPSYNAANTYAAVISDANQNLVTNRAFTYVTPATESDRMQTSGNFIHSLPKHILDDCFPDSKSFAGTDAAPAHYWYIRGDYYVYDQLVSAYTGGADAYNKDIHIPLTMSIQGNAKLRLLNVLPGLYADPAKLPNYTYNAENPEQSVSDSISITLGNVIKTYGQGDPISYWDWYNATNTERAMFVVDGSVYVCNTEATIDGTTYYPGQAIAKDAYTALAGKIPYDGDGVQLVDEAGVAITNAQELFNLANEVNHDNGYLLTIDFSNPSKWDDYYRHSIDQTGDPKKKIVWDKLSDAEKAQYIKSATFTCNESGTYGQYYFNENDVISQSVYAMQSGVTGHVDITTQAQFGEAYIAKDDCEVLVNGVRMSFTKGTSIPKTDYDIIASASNYFEPAYICVSTVLVNTGDYRVLNQLVGETEYNSWSADVKEKFQPAYYCTKTGSWGGKYYESGHNYNGVDYGQLLEAERTHFTFNYDAFDALLYNNYVPNIPYGAYSYDTVDDFKNFINAVGGSNHNTAVSVFDKDPSTNPLYSASVKIDYTATFKGTSADAFTYVKDGVSIPVTENSNAVLANDQYESLPNDRRYYASFAVSDDHLKDKDDHAWSDGKYHTFIVNHTFDVAGNMYNAGKAITHAEYSSLSSIQQGYVDPVVLNGPGTYYYCIEPYAVGANDDNITVSNPNIFPTVVTAVNGSSYAKRDSVTVGTIIDKTTFAKIPDYQHPFEIKGEIPVEETTLYVPVTANIDALQRDRYVTAIYEYTYTESDASGMNFETRVEKHIINIRIEFLSGTPIIGPLKQPDLVLPLETVGLDIPTVQEGAFPILGGGWEIYPTEENAKRHRNGREYVNGGEKLYFYQNDYYVAYYALTRMGKTFSTAVPLTVANYQRMADVITDPNHMYINHRDNDRDPKIYIDGRSADTNGNPIKDSQDRTYANELDAMQAMWSIVNSPYGTEHQEEVNGKSRNITGAANLEFFLQSEVSSQLPSWTSIGGDGTNPCFAGIFHGNGNTITSLNNSLFGSLCGRVYNLGVMGNFTTGGIANTGEGRIENAWVWTSAASPSGQAVYATPGTNARVINAYYPDVNSSFTGSTGNIEITERPVEEFVNGSVAYDLNRYYLEARYRLFGNKSDGTINDNIFYRLPDGTLDKDQTTLIADASGKQPGETGYVTTYANKVYVLNYADTDYARFEKLNGGKVGYVEKYVDDGDFRFSDGNKPLKADLRLSPTLGYLPIYPDDYIFFGQKLSYDILKDAGGNIVAHVKHPEAAAKHHTTGSGEDVDNSRHRLLINDLNDRSENRIYRAPAYFGNGTYGESAIFNARAAFVDSYNFTAGGTSYTTTPHRGMTAIDFTGGNGDTHGYQGVVAGIETDFTDRAGGYYPLLDYERLDAIATQGLTQNLLAYTPEADLPGSKNTQTNTVLVNYFRDPTYAETNATYRTVDVQNTTEIRGHVVQQASTTLTNGDYPYHALVDHLLVDKNDFNAPMAYTFDTGKRMWYQRKPVHYAQNLSTATPDNHDAWETIVLPFTAELVTTQTKGELTHFYGDAADAHVGHEYWLREFSDVKENAGVYKADFERIKNGDNASHTVSNTFLWDYYYSEESQKDENKDTYQTYYNEPRTYTGYRYLTAGTPYIVAFPGSRYYEFDMSGTFLPQNTDTHTWATLPAQTVTYASATETEIPVTDDISSHLTTTQKKGGRDYNFRGTFLNETVASEIYVLNVDETPSATDSGTAFEQVSTGGVKVPFRAYFDVATSSSPAPRRIIIGNGDKDGESEEPMADILTRGLKIYGQKDAIYIESTLDYETTVVITTVSGKLIGRFTVQPQGREVVPVNSRGVYIANHQKVAVL